MAVQKVFIPILNFIYNRTSWMSHRTRTVLMYACLTIIIVSTYFYQAKRFFLYDYPAMLNSLIGVCAFAGFLIVSVDRKIEPVKLRSWLLYTLMLCGLVIMISGLHHYIGYSYILMGFFMTFFMPACIITWCVRKDFDTLFRCIAVIGVACFCIYYIINMFSAPAGEGDVGGRYGGIAADPNGVAKTAVASFVCAGYMMLTVQGWKKLGFLPVMAASIGMTLITVSRANFLAFACIFIWISIIGIKSLFKHRNEKVALSMAAYIVVIALLIPVFINGLHVFADKDFLGNVSESDSTVASETSAAPSKNTVKQAVDVRLAQSDLRRPDTDLNSVSSGRIEIWKYCLQKKSLLGNDIEKGIIVLKDSNTVLYHAHNTCLELLLRSGIFAGGLFLILELYCAWWILRNVFSKRANRTCEIFAIMAITAFGIASLFDIVVLPFAKQTVAMFYLSLPCVMAINHEKEDNKNPDEHI